MLPIRLLPLVLVALAGCAASEETSTWPEPTRQLPPDIRGPIAATVAPIEPASPAVAAEAAAPVPAASEVAPPPAAAPEDRPVPVVAEPASAPVEDDPVPPPPAPEPAPREPAPAPAPPDGDAVAAKDPVADAKARAVVERAAALQDARELADPANVHSFRVVFHKATFESEKRGADGTTTKRLIETDTGGLVFLWKRHAPPRDGESTDPSGGASLRTEVTVDGATTTKAWYEPRKVGWIDDGKSVASLLGPDRKSDLEQLQFQRRLIGRLLDVAILAKLLRDGSTFRILPDSEPYPGTVAVERIPPAGSPQSARLVLWIAKTGEEQYDDVVAARLPPTEDTAGTLDYKFAYHPEFPVVKVKSGDGAPAVAKLRFPFSVVVHERLPEETRARKVLEVNTGSVEVNTVADEAFAQPRRR